MKISEVRVKLVNNKDDRLKAFCSITMDNEFVVRDIKVIEGNKGLFVAMPSRRLKETCPKCGHRNEVRSKYCNECGAGLNSVPESMTTQDTRFSEHKDIAHPIKPECREYVQKNPDVEKGSYLFPYNGRNGYHSKHTLEKSFRRLCKKLGIPRITPHMLRHYFATYALRNGAKLEIVSKILGHSSVAITADVYRTVKQEEIQAEHKKYSPLAEL